MDRPIIDGVSFVSVYVDDFEKAYEFYSEVLGFVKAFDMGEKACYLEMSEDMGLYLQGGNKPVEYAMNTMRCSFTMSVESVSEMFEYLSDAGVRIVQDEPVAMGEELFWFVFYDPCGNMLEVLGEE